MKKHIHLILVLVILMAGIFVRVYDFGNTPYGLNQDEASLGYDAWADMNYGMDRNGDHLPIYAEAWNSGQNMLYNYVTRPFIAILGLNIVAVRLPMLLSGIATLILFYFFLKELFDKKIALLGLFLLAICPWHIMLSRWALESNFVVFVSMLSMHFFVLSRKNNIWFIPAMFTAALCMYAYSATLVFLIAFIPTIVIYFMVKKIIPWKYLFYGIGLFLITALPMGIFLMVNKLELEPCKFLWFTIPRFSWFRTSMSIFDKGNNSFDILSENIMRLKDIFIKMNDGLISNATKFGAIYLFLIPFIIIGIIHIINALKNRKKNIVIPVIWFISAFLQALIIDININRINIIYIPFILLATLGVNVAFKKVRGLSYITIIACVLAFVAFSGYYFNDYNDDAQWMFFGGFDSAVMCASENVASGTIYLSSNVYEPYMITAFAVKQPPTLFTINDGTRYARIPEYIVPEKNNAFILKYDEEIPEYLNINNCSIIEFKYYTIYIIK